LCTALGISDSERQACYRDLFASHVEGKLLEDIRAATKSGMALGNKSFKNELASLTGRRLHPYLQAENRAGVKANSFNVVLDPIFYQPLHYATTPL
jgi:hypothetical protein